jgi:hypothetical protein
MIRATTPTHRFTLPFDYAENVSKVLVTYKQGDEIILEKTEKDITAEGNVMEYTLTQEETKKFAPGKGVSIQVRILGLDGSAMASREIIKPCRDVLNDEVMA